MRRALILSVTTLAVAAMAAPTAHAGGGPERQYFSPDVTVQGAKVSVTTGKVTDPLVTLRLTPYLTTSPTTPVRTCLSATLLFRTFLGCRSTTRAAGTFTGSLSSMTGKRLQAWMALVPIEVTVIVPYLDNLPAGLLTPRTFETGAMIKFSPTR